MEETGTTLDRTVARLGANPGQNLQWLARNKLPDYKSDRIWDFFAFEIDAWVKGGHAAEDVPAAATPAARKRRATRR